MILSERIDGERLELMKDLGVVIDKLLSMTLTDPKEMIGVLAMCQDVIERRFGCKVQVVGLKTTDAPEEVKVRTQKADA